MSGRPRAYLAGPDVFLPQGRELGEARKRVCARFGLEGVFPLDANTEGTAALAPRDKGLFLFDRMRELMEGCDLGLANLTPFRGPSMDVGTAVEVGWLHARGRPVFGYTAAAADYAERVPPDGMEVERFGLADNLMVEGAIVRSGGCVVRGGEDDAWSFGDLDLFERCVRAAVETLFPDGRGQDREARRSVAGGAPEAREDREG